MKMMRSLLFASVSAISCTVPAFGATHYADLNSTNATPTFTIR
jgi:hypothetical protein